MAINGMEHMEARFVQVVRDCVKIAPVSATLDVEEIRRVKTPKRSSGFGKPLISPTAATNSSSRCASPG